jgi:hypothetical protein
LVDAESTPHAGEATCARKTQTLPAVVLGGIDDPIVVLGKKKPRLTVACYDTIKALLEAGEAGLSKDELDTNSEHPEARKYLKRLAANDADWKTVILFPHKSWRRYRLLSTYEAPVT